jgi:hypothetical protein
MPRADRVWTSDELDVIEGKVIDMTFSSAFMYLVAEEGMSLFVARCWLESLAQKHQSSLLSACYAYTRLPQ